MRDYQRLAPFLQGLKTDANARMFYDLFADALVWSDEVPPADSPDRASFSAAELRGVWHFRSSLILGQPKEKFRAAWEEALKCFPNWPGFDPKRRDVSLASTFLSMQDAAMKKWDEDDKRYEAQLSESKKAIA